MVWVLNSELLKKKHSMHITFHPLPSQPTRVTIPLAMSPVLVAPQASLGLLVFVDLESVHQNQEHWKHRSELPLNPATRPTGWDPQWPAEAFVEEFDQKSTTFPETNMAHGISTIFDDIYQERWRFSWAMSVSGRVGFRKHYFWVRGNLELIGFTIALNSEKLLLMEEIRLTSWYGESTIIYRVFIYLRWIFFRILNLQPYWGWGTRDLAERFWTRDLQYCQGNLVEKRLGGQEVGEFTSGGLFQLVSTYST